MHCCPHEESKHRIASNCQEVIHYPSEDYPCLCPGLERCDCEHPPASHVTARVCDECACRTIIR